MTDLELLAELPDLTPLSDEEWDGIFTESPPPQEGPLRQFDRETRCVSSGCRSPTYYKVQGVPLCMTHSLRKLNEILVEHGIEK